MDKANQAEMYLMTKQTDRQGMGSNQRTGKQPFER